MSPATSIVLDLLRFALAAVVVLGHLTVSSIQQGWPELKPLAIVAVGGFFTLSGYIIRMITLDVRDTAGVRKYFADRAARLLSITWPALVVTAACNAISSHAAPEFFGRLWWEGADHQVLRYALNAVLYTQPYGLDLSPQANTPLWSLGYEAGFYVFWGFMLDAKVHGRGPLLTVLALVIYGPHVALMFPCWLLGVLLYDQMARATERSALFRLATLGAAGTLASLIVLALFGASLASLWQDIVLDGLG
ncbi:MAG: acyltransferase family protein, partial [Candidatus Binatia bacterium]